MPSRSRPADPSSTGAPRRAHILVVDDKPLNRKVAEALCGLFDFTTESAADGLEAVDAARSGRFDVILMDINMPGMDGIAAAGAIGEIGGPVGRTPIVAVTADVDPEASGRYLAAGMCAVVEKPIRADQLFLAIQTALKTPRQAARRTNAA